MPSFKHYTHDGCQLRTYFVDNRKVDTLEYEEAKGECVVLNSFLTETVGKGARTHRNCTVYRHTCEGTKG